MRSVALVLRGAGIAVLVTTFGGELGFTIWQEIACVIATVFVVGPIPRGAS